MDPLVSVIVPVYNVRKFMAEALDSLIHQTYPNLEILIIDDGSTDGSSEICDLYEQKDQRIKVFHQENKGLGAARNSGLNHMNGDLVAFLDPDDAYDSDMIRIMVRCMQDLNADIVKCGVSNQNTEEKLIQIEYDNKIETGKWKVLSSREALIALIYGEINMAVWNKLYRRELWNDFRFQEGVFVEDVYTAYQLLNRSDRIGIIPDKLMNHRIWQGSIMQTVNMKLVTDYVNAYEQYETFIRANIPDIYSEEHYSFFKTKTLRKILLKWDLAIIQYPDAAKAIRKELKRRGKETDFSSFPRRLKLKYRMICYCPHLLCLIKKTRAFGRNISARIRRA